MSVKKEGSVNNASVDISEVELSCSSGPTAVGVMSEAELQSPDRPPSSLQCHESYESQEIPGIYAWANIGYLLQYLVIGMIMTVIPMTLYGFFLGYLGVDADVYVNAATLLFLPWTSKIFIGILTDLVPICSLRRVPYMVLGWTICTVGCLLCYFLPMPESYYCPIINPTTGHISGVNFTAICNPGAPDESASKVITLMVCVIGYVISSVAVDGLTVEFGRMEPLESRGQIQSTAYMIRQVGQMIGLLYVGFGMNGFLYLGTFGWTLQWNELMLGCAIPALAMIPISLYLVPEDPKLHRKVSSRSYFKVALCWELLP